MYNIRSYDDAKHGRRGKSIISETYDIFPIPVPGDNMSNYSALIAEASLWYSTNFACQTPPKNPIIGQLWWDTGEKELKVFDSGWATVRQNAIDVGSIAGGLSPENEGLNIGSITRRFAELHVKNAYVSTAFIENPHGSPKNITVSKDGSLSISKVSSGYTDSSGVKPTLPQSLSELSTKLNSTVSSNWTFVDLGTGDTVSAKDKTVYYITHDPVNNTTPLKIYPTAYGIDFQIIIFTNTFFGGAHIMNVAGSAISEYKPTPALFKTVTNVLTVNPSPTTTKINYIHRNLNLPTTTACKRYVSVSILSTGSDGEWDVIMTGEEV